MELYTHEKDIEILAQEFVPDNDIRIPFLDDGLNMPESVCAQVAYGSCISPSRLESKAFSDLMG